MLAILKHYFVHSTDFQTNHTTAILKPYFVHPTDFQTLLEC